MKQHLKLKKTKGDLLGDSTAYRRLSGQLLYLTHTRADSYAMCTLNQFFDQPRKPHLDAAMSSTISQTISGSRPLISFFL